MVKEREMFVALEENPFQDIEMEEILSVVLRGCEMARRLEADLPSIANQKQAIRASCQEIAALFRSAAERLGSQSVSPTSGFDVYVPGPVELFGGGRAVPVREEGPSFYRQDVPMNAPDLGDIGRASSVGRASAAEAMAMVVAAGGGGGEGLGVERAESSRRATWSSSAGQRTSRKRKDSGSGTRTIRVPAPRTGNLDVPPDDGYTWRKYGQKDILHAKFPRSYYRCTHKSFYNCDAKKQLQRLDDDPFTYEVTYCGDHTCQTTTTPLVLPAIPPINVAPPQQQQPQPQPPTGTSVYTSINLGGWLSSGDFDAGGVREGQGGGTATTVGASSQVRGGGGAGSDVESPVADLANVMFNLSGSGSMDAIFFPSSSSTKHHK